MYIILNVELLCGIKNEVNYLTVLFLRQGYTSNNFTFFNWQYLFGGLLRFDSFYCHESSVS